MIRGRELRLSLERKKPDIPKDVNDDFESFANKALWIEEAIERLTIKLVAGALAYVAADTIRKVLIELSRKDIHHD